MVYFPPGGQLRRGKLTKNAKKSICIFPQDLVYYISSRQ